MKGFRGKTIGTIGEYRETKSKLGPQKGLPKSTLRNKPSIMLYALKITALGPEMCYRSTGLSANDSPEEMVIHSCNQPVLNTLLAFKLDTSEILPLTGVYLSMLTT